MYCIGVVCKSVVVLLVNIVFAPVEACKQTQFLGELSTWLRRLFAESSRAHSQVGKCEKSNAGVLGRDNTTNIIVARTGISLKANVPFKTVGCRYPGFSLVSGLAVNTSRLRSGVFDRDLFVNTRGSTPLVFESLKYTNLRLLFFFVFLVIQKSSVLSIHT